MDKKKKDSAPDITTNDLGQEFNNSTIHKNPPTATKPLPRRVYPRGNQGTFVYSPDIAVFIYTEDHGIIDIGPYITSFNVQRGINTVSGFSCTFDNKWSRYDRVIRRMDRVAVFLKRIEWVQVFAGYITEAPWETVVPGDATLVAECTLKRLYHTYFDPYSTAARTLFPVFFADRSWHEDDGGAAVSLFKLLTQVVHWDPDKIKIQDIPQGWIETASKLLMKVQRKDYDLFGNELQQLQESMKKLLSFYGWIKQDGTEDTSQDSGQNQPDANVDVNSVLDGEREWRKQNAWADVNCGSGSPCLKELSPKHTSNVISGNIALRKDAAAAWEALIKDPKLKLLNNGLLYGYVEQEQIDSINQQLHGVVDIPAPTPSESSQDKVRGEDGPPEGWGEGVALEGAANSTAVKNVETMNKYGWYQVSGMRWAFLGSETYPLGKGVTGFDQTKLQNGPSATTTDTAQSVTNAIWFWPGYDVNSDAFVGTRAWINDVPVFNVIMPLAQAANRDFMSAPNGDFVAFFPDRTGMNGKFPAVLIRDIEILDFKLSVNDSQLVTHYISVGDFFGPAAPTGNIDLNAFLIGGMVTIEMEELMKYLLGLEPEANVEALGKWMLNKFGIRPLREDNPQIRNLAWNYTIALQRFQEQWANQWNAIVEFTFLPEIYPGMRVELVDKGLAVYVEGVQHSGSRTGGFTTSVTISTPMYRDKKNPKRWTMLRAEWPSGLLESDATQDYNNSNHRDAPFHGTGGPTSPSTTSVGGMVGEAFGDIANGMIPDPNNPEDL